MCLFSIGFAMSKPDVLRCAACQRSCYGDVEIQETRLEPTGNSGEVAVEMVFRCPRCRRVGTARQKVEIDTVLSDIRFALTFQRHKNQIFPFIPRKIEKPTPSRRVDTPVGAISDDELQRARDVLACTEFVVKSPSWRAFIKACGGERLLWEDIEPDERPEGWDD